mgnify:FL=1
MEEDILGREQFVNQVTDIIATLSCASVSTSFAINGAWGSGKSFVLDMLEHKLISQTIGGKINCVIRYNCWENDYYDEPLFALISSTITSLQDMIYSLPKTREARVLKGILKASVDSLATLTAMTVKNRTGVELDKAIELIRRGIQYGDKELKDITKYDNNFWLRKDITQLAKSLKDLSDKYNIVIIVDELDRCLPEYAMKVLERLHHLTAHGKVKIVNLVSIDKGQLTASINKTFGYTDMERYLEKFFSFELELNNGKLSERFWQKYDSYFSMFDKDAINFNEPVVDFIKLIFGGITIRKQEQIIQKAMLTHNLLGIKGGDYIFLCMELFLAVNKYEYSNMITFSNNKKNTIRKISDVFFFPSNKPTPDFLKKLQNLVDSSGFHRPRTAQDTYRVPDDMNLYAAITLAWTRLYEINPPYLIQCDVNTGYRRIISENQNLQRFKNLLGYLH